MSKDFDFAIFGSGFGASIMAMILRRLGYSVFLLEKGRHPRFAIGESSTPFASLLLERISEEYELPALRPFCEWGSWRRAHPEIPCGLKRGFTFFHHTAGEPLDLDDPERRLLVAASPADAVADTHWHRPAFDHLLAREAQRLGAELEESAELLSLKHDDRWHIRFRSRSGEAVCRAGFILDASGHHSTIPARLGVARESIPGMPGTSGLYAHFRGVRPLPGIGADAENWPYPPEAAAVHHLFEGGWIWVLHFNNGITSAGAALTAGKARDIGLATAAPADVWRRLLRQCPSLDEQFREASLVTPMFTAPRLSFQCGRASGPGWVLLPSAAGFVDPLLSTGFPLTLLGITRLARAFTGTAAPKSAELESFEAATFSELRTAAALVSALYAKLDLPVEFSRLTLLYFAAMSYTETAWRLGKTQLAPGFLLSGHPRFPASLRQICAAAAAGEPITEERIRSVIEPFDAAGLSDFSRFPHYPVRAADLIASREKFGATADEMLALFAKCGLPSPPEFMHLTTGSGKFSLE